MQVRVNASFLVAIYLMGCSPCQMASSESEPVHRSRSRLSVPIDSMAVPRRVLTPTKQLKLRQSNYVVVSNARLSDIYEIQGKVGEGEE